MEYDVVMKKKLEKGVKKLPLWVQKKLVALVLDLKEKGPEQPKWQNYSKLKQHRTSLSFRNIMGSMLATSKKNYNDRGVLCWQS